jgi:hypothetical protein
METDPCPACANGTLVWEKRHRLPTGVAVLGYCLIVLSALALAFGVLMMVFAWGITQAGMPAETKQELDQAQIPADIRARVEKRESISDADTRNLTPQQKKVIRDAQSHMSAQTLAFGMTAALVGISGAILAVLSLGGMLLGWLLRLRKNVYVCHRCGAVAT